MDFEFSPQAEQLRKEIRAFVKENLPPGYIGRMFVEEHSDEEWKLSMDNAKKLAERGWLTMSWPKEFGGLGASTWEKVVYREECGYWGMPGTGMGVSGVHWVGPSLMLFGTDEQKKKYLPPIAAGDPDGVWCTGYSEPDAGSDFASLQTRAERKGDEYVINGQKVWTSAAHRARWCWLAVRTDPNAAKKHHGLSIMIVDMQSPGVTVRRIRNFVGMGYFNEVFFNDVRVPAANLVGQENRGWYHLMQALAFERGIALGSSGIARRFLEEMVMYAKESGLMRKPVVRQSLAEVAADIACLRLMAYEAAWKADKGVTVIHEPSRDKAFNDMLLEKLTLVGTRILGAYSQIDSIDREHPLTRIKGAIEHQYYCTPGLAVAAGTTDTQRNIVGQFGLQLPRAY